MTLYQLYYFRKLAELQHFTKSAAELFISQSSLSLSMKNLEKELGTPLFQKEGRNVVLTSAGEEFYKCVVEVFTTLNAGVATLKQNIESNSAKINIGTVPILPGDFISKNIRSYMELYPDATFDMFTCITHQKVIKSVKNGGFDIGFCSEVSPENDLVFVPILSQELVVITEEGHELSKRKSIKLLELQKYPFITYRDNNPLGVYIRNLFTEKNIIPNIVFSFDGEVTISEMVSQAFGIAILVNTPILRNYNLSIIPLNEKVNSATLYLTYHKNSYHSKSVASFIRHITENTTMAYI